MAWQQEWGDDPVSEMVGPWSPRVDPTTAIYERVGVIDAVLSHEGYSTMTDDGGE